MELDDQSPVEGNGSLLNYNSDEGQSQQVKQKQLTSNQLSPSSCLAVNEKIYFAEDKFNDTILLKDVVDWRMKARVISI